MFTYWPFWRHVVCACAVTCAFSMVTRIPHAVPSSWSWCWWKTADLGAEIIRQKIWWIDSCCTLCLSVSDTASIKTEHPSKMCTAHFLASRVCVCESGQHTCPGHRHTPWSIVCWIRHLGIHHLIAISFADGKNTYVVRNHAPDSARW